MGRNDRPTPLSELTFRKMDETMDESVLPESSHGRCPDMILGESVDLPQKLILESVNMIEEDHYCPTHSPAAAIKVLAPVVATIVDEKIPSLEEAEEKKIRQASTEDKEEEDTDDEEEHPEFGPREGFEMPEVLPSLGSAGHGDGTCKRCCFFPKGRCENGYDCEFCHFDHEKRKRLNKKKKKAQSTQSSTEEGSELPSNNVCGEAAPMDAEGAEILALLKKGRAAPPPAAAPPVAVTPFPAPHFHADPAALPQPAWNGPGYPPHQIHAPPPHAFQPDASPPVYPSPLHPGAALPEGWACYHDDRGVPYYHHEATGRTQWEAPGLPPAPSAATPVGGPSYVAPNGEFVSMPPWLPAGWKEVTKPTGEKYYWDGAGMTSWAPPAGSLEPQPPPPPHYDYANGAPPAPFYHQHPMYAPPLYEHYYAMPPPVTFSEQVPPPFPGQYSHHNAAAPPPFPEHPPLPTPAPAGTSSAMASSGQEPASTKTIGILVGVLERELAGAATEKAQEAKQTAQEKEEEEEEQDDEEGDEAYSSGPLEGFVMPEVLPSLGSAGHGDGTCKRCCFFPKGRCENGYDCEFCHFDHEKRKRLNKKRKNKGKGNASNPQEGYLFQDW